jgi:hypothetical protein
MLNVAFIFGPCMGIRSDINVNFPVVQPHGIFLLPFIVISKYWSLSPILQAHVSLKCIMDMGCLRLYLVITSNVVLYLTCVEYLIVQIFIPGCPDGNSILLNASSFKTSLRSFTCQFNAIPLLRRGFNCWLYFSPEEPPYQRFTMGPYLSITWGKFSRQMKL